MATETTILNCIIESASIILEDSHGNRTTAIFQHVVDNNVHEWSRPNFHTDPMPANQPIQIVDQVLEFPNICRDHLILASTRPNLTRHFKCNLYHIYGTDVAMEDEGYVKILIEYTNTNKEFYFFAYVKTNMLKNSDGLRELPFFLNQQEPLFHAS